MATDQFSACTVQNCTVEIYFLYSIAITFQPASNESACTVSLSLAVFGIRYLSRFNSDFGAVKTKIGQLNQHNHFSTTMLAEPTQETKIKLHELAQETEKALPELA